MASIDQILRERRAAARRTTTPRFTPQSQRRRIAQSRRQQTAPRPPPTPPGGGGRGPTPFAQTKAGLTFAATEQRAADVRASAREDARLRKKHRDDLVIQATEQKFLDDQLKKRLADEAKVRAEERERTRQSNISQLRVERQGTFAQLLASGDQARAVMFALGFGPENDTFDVRARTLGTTIRELKGARQLETTTEAALSRVLGREVDISREGVRGLGSAVGAARQFVQGGADIQQLLTSAFGVGSLREGERPGISQARLGELIQQVTPTGVL